MIAFPAGVKVWIVGGVTDMRRGMNTLALQGQEGPGRDPHVSEIFCFRGRRGDLMKLLRHDGVGMSLCAKRLEGGVHLARQPLRRGSADRRSPARLPAGGHRLAQSALDTTSCKGRINHALSPFLFSFQVPA